MPTWTFNCFSSYRAKQVQKAEVKEWTDEEIFELLKDVPYREYEAVLRKHGIMDFRAILKYKEMVKLRLAEEEEIKKKEVKVEEAPKVVEEKGKSYSIWVNWMG